MADAKLYTLLDLVGRLRLSETTIRKMVREGRFPRPCYPVEGSARWTESQVQTYLAALEMGLIAPLPKPRKRTRQTPAAESGQEESGPRPTTPSRARQRKEAPDPEV